MVREYRYLWHAEAPGMFLLGPLLLTVGGKTHRLEGLEVQVLGPPDMQAEAWELDSWVPTPMEFSAAGRPRVTQTGEDLLVVVAYGDRVSVSPSPDTDAQELVLRDMDRPRFRALRYLNGGAVKRTVEVFRQGKQVLKTSVGGSPPP